MAKGMRRLYVKRISPIELKANWGIPLPQSFTDSYAAGKGLFIRSNAKGTVNWEKNPVYIGDELKGKNFVIVNKLKAV